MKKILLFATVMVLLCASCSQKMLSSHTVGNKPISYSKILVVVKAKNETQRVEMEDDIVESLKKENISAEPSYNRLSSKMLKAKANDEEALEEFAFALRKKGFEGILVTSLVDASESIDYNPGQYHTARVPVRYGRFGRYYGTTNVAVYEPSSVEKHLNIILESLLYDLRGSSKENSLHWMGKFEITDPSNFDATSDRYSKNLVKKLTKEAISN